MYVNGMHRKILVVGPKLNRRDEGWVAAGSVRHLRRDCLFGTVLTFDDQVAIFKPKSPAWRSSPDSELGRTKNVSFSFGTT